MGGQCSGVKDLKASFIIYIDNVDNLKNSKEENAAFAMTC